MYKMVQVFSIVLLTIFAFSIVFIISIQELQKKMLKEFNDLKSEIKYQQNVNNMNYLMLKQQRKALKQLLRKLDDIIMYTCPKLDENAVKLFSELFDKSKGVPCVPCTFKDTECDPNDENITFPSIFYPIYELFDEMMEDNHKNVHSNLPPLASKGGLGGNYE